MLSIGKLAAGQEGYYLNAVGHGAEEYYLGAGEVPGYWIGTGALELGIDGPVDDDSFVALLRGVSPVDGTALGRANRRVPAMDLTFSAPKSVSVAWALGGRDVAREIVAAHRGAIAAAVSYLEREAVFVRRGHNGTERLIGGGLVGAAFRHRTSRAGDPQLHTHVVVANAAQGPDGRWSALDARHLYGQARTAGFLYQAELRTGLSARVSASWGPVVRGAADLAVVPEAVRDEFSQRRAQIEAVVAPEASSHEARAAALQTRSAKSDNVDVLGLHAEWLDRADRYGFGPEELARSLHRHARREDVAGDGPVRSVRVSVPVLCAELTEQQSAFDRRHVLQALAGHARTGATVTDLEMATDEFLAGEAVVPLGVGRFGMCYSTPELLALEAHTIEQATSRVAEECAVVTDLAPILDEYTSLSAEQARMVRALTQDGAGVAVVVGAAGSGKTYALQAARDAWSDDEYAVIGCALAARAARQLTTEARIPSVTLDRLLHGLEGRDLPGFTDRTVVVADEAAMIGTRKLARLLDHAHRAGAKVVLVGDPHQLPEIEAGGMFTALAQELPTATLVENRRQRDPIERQALADLRAGHIDEAIERLAEHGHLIETADRQTAIKTMVADWHAAVRRGDDAIMLAQRRADVADLNAAARELLVADGVVNDYRLTYSLGKPFAIGDRIITLRNDEQHRLINGQRATIVGKASDGILVQPDDDPHRRNVPGTHLDAGNIDYAYAMTIHKSQGLTCDRAYLLASPDLYAEAGYTALSRGRHENRLYVAADDETGIDHHGALETDPLDDIRFGLWRTRYKELATQQLARSTLRPRSGIEREAPAVELDDGIDVGW